ncbi:hypothetical protein HMPREF0262_00264 [Clostridium sp. ATCC 29733]|nr:hypothetical protein HMPREF0262_00264 [Clostridium sp. ATCC 29733]
MCCAARRTPLNMGAFSFGCWAGRRTCREGRGKPLSGRRHSEQGRLLRGGDGDALSPLWLKRPDHRRGRREKRSSGPGGLPCGRCRTRCVKKEEERQR